MLNSLRNTLTSTTCAITLGGMPWNTLDFKSVLVQVMAWFQQALSHYHWGETWCANVHVRASKMEDRKSGAQTRCHFSHLTLIFRLEIDIQESSCLEWIHAISNLTGSVLYCCWAACEIWRKMRERTWYDALTYIASKQRMRERTLRCANERFLVPTNEHRLLASRRYHL